MGSSEDLRKLRKRIDDLDSEILSLLNKRAEVVLGIGEHKKENFVGVYDPKREKEIEKKLRELNTGPLSDNSILGVYREIISACRALQYPLRVSYLGPEGSFSYQAAYNEFGGSAELIPAGSFEEIFEEVETGRSSLGVVPVENSNEGSIGRVLDLLSASSLTVSAELFERINLFLLSKSGSLGEVRVVASHPQPLAQSKKWISKKLPHAKIRETASTTDAAKLASRNKEIGAVASRHSASIYKLNVLGKNIEDSKSNTTRFFVIGRQMSQPSGDDRTSIVFSLKDKPGELQKVFFQPFAEAGVNLTKIESRPSRENPWEYLFFVDFKGHRDEKTVEKLLARLAGKSVSLKVLGSYPVGAPGR